MKYCTQCGAQQQIDARFCAICGSQFNSDPISRQLSNSERSMSIGDKTNNIKQQTVPSEGKTFTYVLIGILLFVTFFRYHWSLPAFLGQLLGLAVAVIIIRMIITSLMEQVFNIGKISKIRTLNIALTIYLVIYIFIWIIQTN